MHFALKTGSSSGHTNFLLNWLSLSQEVGDEVWGMASSACTELRKWKAGAGDEKQLVRRAKEAQRVKWERQAGLGKDWRACIPGRPALVRLVL
jgi:hypothetical protein